MSGITLLVLARGIDIGITKLPGVAFGLASAIFFALGTVLTKRLPLGLPPATNVMWQVAIGCLPLVIGAWLFDDTHFERLETGHWLLLLYGGLVGLGVGYLPWFAALKRLPASVAALGTLITPCVGVMGAVIFLGEPLGWTESIALLLTITGVALAVRG
jgi:drug/metabolite transporter (DMT)-like permease